jgi:hypothetical protein
MKILLDECVPWPMHKFLLDHECTTAQRAGWGGIKNGELLLRAEGKYDLFVNGITKRLPGVLAVDRVSFNLQRGELLRAYAPKADCNRRRIAYS